MLYEDPCTKLPSAKLLYKDYCLSLMGMNGSAGLTATPKYQNAKEYWWERVHTLPPAPELPVLVSQDGQQPTGRFEQLGSVLSADMFAQLKSTCAASGVSPTSLMLTIYSTVLGRFARSKHFMLNIVHCLRHPVHDDVSSLFGNFSSSFLLDVDLQHPSSLLTHARNLQLELSSSLEHATISGVEVRALLSQICTLTRCPVTIPANHTHSSDLQPSPPTFHVQVMEQYNKTHGKVGSAVAPFVFVSGMGLEHALPDWKDQAFTESHMEERTPGAWVINVVKEYPDGRLACLFQVMEGLFPLEVSRGMAS
eukprot:6018781-Prymnesium_polylepis.1